MRVRLLLPVCALFAQLLIAIAQPVLSQSDLSGISTIEPDDFFISEIHLRSKKVLEHDFFAYTIGEEISLPLRSFMDIIDFPVDYESSSESLLLGYFLRENQAYKFDFTTRQANIAGAIYDIGSKDVIKIEGQKSIALSTLNELFALNAKWKPFEQAIDVDPPYLLPVEEFERRTATAENRPGKRNSAIPDNAISIKSDHKTISWPHLTLNASANIEQSGSTNGFVSLLGVSDILHATGHVNGSLTTNGDAEVLLRLERQSAENKIAGPLKANKIEAGDLFSKSLPLISQSATTGTGISIRRGPGFQSGRFDVTDLVGDAPPGWQIELYRNSSLLSLQDVPANGRYLFTEVPLTFGINRFRFELYGPSGERRTIERLIDVNNRLIKPRELQYDFSVIDRNTSLIDGSANEFSSTGLNTGIEAGATVGYGVNRNLSLRANTIYIEPELAQSRVFATIGQTSSLRGIFFESDTTISSRGGWANRFGIGTTLRSTSLTLDHTQYENFESAENVIGDDRINTRWSGRVSGNVNAFNLSASTRREVRNGGIVDTSSSLRASRNFSRLSVTQSINHRSRAEPLEENETSVRASTSVSGRINKVRTRASVDWSLSPTADVRRARGVLSLRQHEWFHQVSFSRDFESGSNNYFVRSSRDWNGVRLSGEMRFNDNTDVLEARLALALSLDKSPLDGKLRVGRNALSKDGTIKLTGYYDENSNGKRDAKEANLSGVDFSLSERGRISQGEDYILVESLPVDRMVGVVVNSGGLDDPYLSPTSNFFKTQARPGSVQHIDIAFVDTGEVIASVLAPDESPIANQIIMLKGADSTREYKVRSAFDGQAYFQNVIPGKYEFYSGDAMLKLVEIVAGDVNYISTNDNNERDIGPKAQQEALGNANLATQPVPTRNDPGFVSEKPIKPPLPMEISTATPIEYAKPEVSFIEYFCQVDELPRTMIVQKHRSRIRSMPAFKGRILASLAKGTSVEVIAQCANWFQVSTINALAPRGFMHKSTVAGDEIVSKK